MKVGKEDSVLSPPIDLYVMGVNKCSQLKKFGGPCPCENLFFFFSFCLGSNLGEDPDHRDPHEKRVDNGNRCSLCKDNEGTMSHSNSL